MGQSPKDKHAKLDVTPKELFPDEELRCHKAKILKSHLRCWYDTENRFTDPLSVGCTHWTHHPSRIELHVRKYV